jgi:hypothetical protein
MKIKAFLLGICLIAQVHTLVSMAENEEQRQAQELLANMARTSTAEEIFAMTTDYVGILFVKNQNKPFPKEFWEKTNILLKELAQKQDFDAEELFYTLIYLGQCWKILLPEQNPALEDLYLAIITCAWETTKIKRDFSAPADIFVGQLEGATKLLGEPKSMALYMTTIEKQLLECLNYRLDPLAIINLKPQSIEWERANGILETMAKRNLWRTKTAKDFRPTDIFPKNDPSPSVTQKPSFFSPIDLEILEEVERLPSPWGETFRQETQQQKIENGIRATRTIIEHLEDPRISPVLYIELFHDLSNRVKELKKMPISPDQLGLFFQIEQRKNDLEHRFKDISSQPTPTATPSPAPSPLEQLPVFTQQHQELPVTQPRQIGRVLQPTALRHAERIQYADIETAAPLIAPEASPTLAELAALREQTMHGEPSWEDPEQTEPFAEEGSPN